jgi:hypothetical protein
MTAAQHAGPLRNCRRLTARGLCRLCYRGRGTDKRCSLVLPLDERSRLQHEVGAEEDIYSQGFNRLTSKKRTLRRASRSTVTA